MIQCVLFTLEGLQKEMSLLCQMQFHSRHPLSAPTQFFIKGTEI